MANTIREIVILDFMARVTTITMANGYNTDCGAHTPKRAQKNLEPADLPAIVVWPGTEKVEAAYGHMQCTMSMRIEGIALFGAENHSVVSEKILGDLKKCILSSSWTRSPDYIDSVIYTGGGTDEYPEAGQVSIGAMATFDVSYTTKIDDPYSQ